MHGAQRILTLVAFNTMAGRTSIFGSSKLKKKIKKKDLNSITLKNNLPLFSFPKQSAHIIPKLWVWL